MTDPVRYCASPHVLWRRTLESVVLLPPVIDEPFALTGTGPELWGLLSDPRSLDDLVHALAEVHGAADAVVAADVEPLLVRLVELGAPVVADGNGDTAVGHAPPASGALVIDASTSAADTARTVALRRVRCAVVVDDVVGGRRCIFPQRLPCSRLECSCG